MSNIPEGAEFEPDAPWRQDPLSYDICDECGGEGHFNETECCCSDFYEPGWPDIDICYECGEHSEPATCEKCKGEGKILTKIN